MSVTWFSLGPAGPRNRRLFRSTCDTMSPGPTRRPHGGSWALPRRSTAPRSSERTKCSKKRRIWTGSMHHSGSGSWARTPSWLAYPAQWIRRSDTGLEYWLPTAPDAPSAWEVDIRSAALGAPLPDGQWSLKINTYTADGEPVARSSVPPTPLGTGVVDGRLVVPAGVKGAFVIDVGATKLPPVFSLDADQVQITEDARGALFTARMPKVHTTSPAVIDGAITLDRFSLPARLVADEHEVRLQFFVSGLAGENALSTRFGAAPAAPTGLNLVITGTGDIGVAPTPPPPPAAARKPTAPPKPVAPPKPTTPPRKPTKKA